MQKSKQKRKKTPNKERVCVRTILNASRDFDFLRAQSLHHLRDANRRCGLATAAAADASNQVGDLMQTSMLMRRRQAMRINEQ
jgi:hypothetical protein